MKRTNLFGLLALAAVATLAAFSQAEALQTTKAFKEVVITIVITPSPTPVAMHYVPGTRPITATAVAAAPAISRLVANPFTGPAQLASSGSSWDVAPQPLQIAQVTPVQPTPVPVRFIAKPDPNALYLRIIPHTGVLNVGYGDTDFLCVYEVFTHYMTPYQLTDWGWGTTNAITTGTYPIWNYNRQADLLWAVPDFSPTFSYFANQGAPGQHVWNGTAGSSQQHCFSIRVHVPNTQPAGTYTATIEYTLIVS